MGFTVLTAVRAYVRERPTCVGTFQAYGKLKSAAHSALTNLGVRSESCIFPLKEPSSFHVLCEGYTVRLTGSDFAMAHDARDNEATSQLSKDPNARPECFHSTAQEVLFVISVTMAVAMSAFLSGSVTVSVTFAAKELNMSNAEVTWMVSLPGT